LSGLEWVMLLLLLLLLLLLTSSIEVCSWNERPDGLQPARSHGMPCCGQFICSSILTLTMMDLVTMTQVVARTWHAQATGLEAFNAQSVYLCFCCL